MKSTSPFKGLAVAGLSACALGRALAATALDGNINGALPRSGSPYTVARHIEVLGGQTLTIDPGVVIKFGPSADLLIDGTLTAVGTASSPILFTSLQEGATAAAPGQWGDVQFVAGSSASRLSNCIIRYGGATNGMDVWVQNSSPTISQSLITLSSHYGVYAINGLGPNLIHNQITKNIDFGLVADAQIGTLDGNLFDGNGNGVQFVAGPGSPVMSNTVFKNTKGDIVDDYSVAVQDGGGNVADASNAAPGIDLINNIGYSGTYNFTSLPYLIRHGEVEILGARVTVAPGAVFKFALTAGYTAPRFTAQNGTLIAAGTAAAPIVFTSIRDSSVGGNTDAFEGNVAPAPGDWNGLAFYNGTGASRLDHVIVRYAGIQSSENGQTDGAIDVAGSSVTISNSLIAFSSQIGISAMSGIGPTVTGNQFVHNAQWGLRATGLVGPITGNTFDHNGGGILFDGDHGSPTLTNNTFTNTADKLIEDRTDIYLQDGGGNTADSTNRIVGIDLIGTWTSGTLGFRSFPYLVRSQLNLGFGTPGQAVTVAPGMVFKASSAGFINLGEFSSVGTSSAPITFTSLRDRSVGGNTDAFEGTILPAPGDWDGIKINAPGARLDYVMVRYGGALGSGELFGGSNPTVAHSVISYSSTNGMNISGTGTFSLNTFSNNQQYGVQTSGGTQLNNNNIENNARGGLNATGDATTNAQNNYWGDPSGPGGLGSGRGNGVYGNVTFIPFLSSPVSALGSDALPPRTVFIPGPLSVGANPVLISSQSLLGFAAFDDRSTVGDNIGDGVAKTEYKVDGGTFAVFTSSFSVPAPGRHVVSFFSTDVDGHVEAATSTIVWVDTVAPVTRWTESPAPYVDAAGKIIASGVTRVGFQWTSSAPVAATSFMIDGSAPQIFGSPFPLPEGRHTLYFQSVDVLKNTERLESVTLYADTTAPKSQLSIRGSLGSLSDGSVQIDSASYVILTATDPVSNGLSSGVQSIQLAIDTAAYSTYVGSFSITAQGRHQIQWKAIDHAGNSEVARSTTVVLSSGSAPPPPPPPPPPPVPPPPPPPPPPGNTGPVVSSIGVSPSPPLSRGTVTLTVHFSQPMNNTVNPQVLFTPPGASSGIAVNPTSYVGDTWTGSFAVTASMGTGNGTVTVSGASDAAGNFASSYTTTVFVSNPVLGVPQQVTVNFQTLTGTLHLAWQPPAGTSPAAYNLYRSNAPMTTLAGLTPLLGTSNLSADDWPPAASAAVYYAVTALASDGTESAPSGNVSFAMPLPPVIMSPVNGAHVDVSSTIVSGIAQPGVTIQFALSTSGSPLASVTAAADGRWSDRLTLGQGNVTLLAYAKSSFSSTVSSAAAVSFNISALPLPPTALHATAGDTTVTLRWSVPPQTNIAGFRVYRDGNPVSLNLNPIPANQLSYQDLAITDGRVYVYTVTTVRADGIESYPSVPAQAIPTAGPLWNPGPSLK